MITIIDYGVGNLNSIVNIIKYLGGECRIAQSSHDILNADKLILPGVGSFDLGMESLQIMEIVDSLNIAVQQKKIPILGICLGMQLMTIKSEEGKLQGLGWIDAEVKKFLFENGSTLKTPHMGWNLVQVKKKNPVISYSDIDLRFYFVHSYYVQLKDNNLSLAQTNYGIDFCSAFQRDNIFGVQFHPEKSHRHGMNLIKSFMNI